MSQEKIDSSAATTSANRARFNLAGYFDRIGYSGNGLPTLETLAAIHRLHAQSIPFENLNPLLRLPVVLDMDALYAKLVLNQRGGYCFEQNLLLMEALKSIGYDVKGLAARVLWNTPDGTITPRGHMLLLIKLEGGYFIADVGFGGLTLTAPLLLETEIEQSTPHEDFKLIGSGDEYVLLAQVQGFWKRIYSFSLQESFLQDYEVTSWYLSNNPSSHFVTSLIAALPFDNGRHVLRNADFATHFITGRHERQRIDNVRDLRNLLENTFRIAVPDTPHTDEFFERIIQTPSKK